MSQGLSSLSNAIVSVVASFALTSSALGALALSLIVYRVALMTTDGVVGSVLLIRLPRLAGDEAAALSSAGRRTTLAIGLVGASIAATVAAMWLRGGPLLTPFLTIAVFLPALLLHETLRVQAFALHLPKVAMGGDAIWVALGGIGAFFVAVSVQPATAWQLLSAWCIGAVIGALYMVARLTSRYGGRTSRISIGEYLHGHRQIAGAYLADNVVANGSAELASVAISAGLGLSALGTWRTASIVFSPLDPLPIAVMRWAVPRATGSTRTHDEIRRDFRRLGMWLGACSAVLVVPFGILALHISHVSAATSAWSGIAPLIVPSAILTVTRAFVMPFFYLIRIEERARLLVKVRLVDGVSLMLVIAAASTMSLSIVAWSYAIHRVVIAVAWVAASQRMAAPRDAGL